MQCIEHTQAAKKYGRTTITVQGRKSFVYLHRVAYCKHHGVALSSIEGQVVRHKCDNPRCINPDHLELGTVADNNRDTRERGRAAYQQVGYICPLQGTGRPFRRAEANPNSKLNWDKVQSIRQQHSEGRTLRVLAAEFGVGVATVHQVVQLKTWLTPHTDGV